MARFARVVVPGCPHHVTQRGNRRIVTFVDDEDRRVYLRLLAGACARYGLKIWAYALMSNHVHLVAVPENEGALAPTVRDAHGAYALYFNHRHGTTGHLWQGRFFSCVDEPHLWCAVRYVERNPVRAGLVEHAEDYPWSSAAAHSGLRSDPLLADDFPPHGAIPDWADWLRGEESVEQRSRLRHQTLTGRPCGSQEFVAELEHQLSRKLLPQKRGPKPKPEPETPRLSTPAVGEASSNVD